MYRYHKIAAVIAAVSVSLCFVLFPSCSKSEEIITYPSSYTDNGLAVSSSTVEKTVNGCEISSISVTLSGLSDKSIQNKIADDINLSIASCETTSPPEYRGIARLVNPSDIPASISVTYDVKANFGDMLSMLLTRTMTYANGNVISGSSALNYDLSDGSHIETGDLFDPDYDASSPLDILLTSRVSSLFLFENAARSDSYSGVDTSGCYLISPFRGLRNDIKFTFDASGITFYIDEATDEFIVDPSVTQSVFIEYNSELFSRLIIFRDHNTDLYESSAAEKHLLAYPSDIVLDYTDKVNGMSIKALELVPADFISGAAKERVEKLMPSIEDITSQATGSGNEYYYCYFYAERVGKFMIIRLSEEDSSGMNSSSSDRIYVFDADTAKNLSYDSLFTADYNYTSAFASIILPDGSNDDLVIIEKALSGAQIIPREDHFLVRVKGLSASLSSGETLTELNEKIHYSDIGYENLLIYD